MIWAMICSCTVTFSLWAALPCTGIASIQLVGSLLVVVCEVLGRLGRLRGEIFAGMLLTVGAQDLLPCAKLCARSILVNQIWVIHLCKSCHNVAVANWTRKFPVVHVGLGRSLVCAKSLVPLLEEYSELRRAGFWGSSFVAASRDYGAGMKKACMCIMYRFRSLSFSY